MLGRCGPAGEACKISAPASAVTPRLPSCSNARRFIRFIGSVSFGVGLVSAVPQRGRASLLPAHVDNLIRLRSASPRQYGSAPSQATAAVSPADPNSFDSVLFSRESSRNRDTTLSQRHVKMFLPARVKKVFKSSLLEEPLEKMIVMNGFVEFSCAPHEIVTFIAQF